MCGDGMADGSIPQLPENVLGVAPDDPRRVEAFAGLLDLAREWRFIPGDIIEYRVSPTEMRFETRAPDGRACNFGYVSDYTAEGE